MPTRNKLGQYTGNDGNYIYLPSFSKIIKISFILLILYPWYLIVSDLKTKISFIIAQFLSSIPTPGGGENYTNTTKPKPTI